MTRVASFHLGEFPRRRAISKMVTLPAERWELSSTDGCLLGKVLATSWPGTTKVSADVGRWAIFAVWQDEKALSAFLAGSPMIQRWQRAATLLSHMRLTPLASKGTWGGVDPFPALGLAGRRQQEAGRVAVLTHARIRATKALAFLKEVPAVDDALRRQPGNELAMGLGEWPFVQQATFSVWKSSEDLRAFAHEGDEHRAAMRRAHKERWFTEELFTRFLVRKL